MANTNAPFGFRQFGRREGGSPTAGMDRFVINSSDTNPYFTGNVVGIAGGVVVPFLGSSDSVPVLGVFQGCEYFNTTVNRQVWSPYFPASVGSSSPVTAYVCTDPEQLYIVQGSSTAITAASVGANVNVLTNTSSTGNTTTGISATVIASTQTALSASLPFAIVDLYSNVAPPGVAGTDNANNFNIVVVAPNNWRRHAGVISS